MVMPRSDARSVLLPNGDVFVTGGMLSDDLQNRAINGTEIYNPAANTWTLAANLTEARYGFVMALLSNGRVIVVGGARDYEGNWNNNSFVRAIELYDPATNHWQVVGELAHPTAHAAATLLSDGRFWITGGQSGRAIYSLDTWMVQPLSPNPD